MIVVWALWSLIAWPLGFLILFLCMITCLPAIFIPFEKFQAGLPQFLFALVPRVSLSRITHRYHPRHNMSQVAVYIGNHTSLFDACIYVGTLGRRPVTGMMNQAHTLVPFYGQIMKLANAIFVPRASAGRRFDTLNELVLDRVRRGISVYVMPEAHRTLDGKLRDFKRGGFFMARNAGLPMVPVAVRGLYTVLPKGAYIMRPGHIETYIGPPVETKGMTDAQVGELAKRMRLWIAAWAERNEMPDDRLLDLSIPVPHLLAAATTADTAESRTDDAPVPAPEASPS